VKNCCKKNETTDYGCTIEKAVVSDPKHVPLEGKLNVAFIKTAPNIKSNYWVLSTDYVNYSIVYYCEDLPENKSSELFWLLSKKPELTAEVKKTTDELVDKHFTRAAIYEVTQTAATCDPRTG